MQTTPNIGLRKPENNDGFGQDDFGFNSDVLDALLEKIALRTGSISQSIPNASATALSFTAADITDTDAMHDPAVNPSKFVCRVAGYFGGIAMVAWAINGVGVRNVFWKKNGAFTEFDVMGPNAGGSFGSRQIVPCFFELAVNDSVEVFAFHDAGAALSINGAQVSLWREHAL